MKKTLISAILFLAGCLPQNGIELSESGTIGGTKIPPPDPRSTICDPFNPEHNGSSIYGLKGALYYLEPQQPRYESVLDYLNFGSNMDDMFIYLSRLYVPTRPFDRGFVTQAGQTVTTKSGDTLYEYFAMRLRSQLVLKKGQPAGAYQLAILSDDGAILSFASGFGFQEFLNNDQVHPTKMKCATVPLEMKESTRLPMILDYFQGPRWHISMIMMWRPWVDGSDMSDPLCDHTSNEDFFDSTQDPPVAGFAYQQLLDRGWQPLDTENFLLEEGINPCHPESDF